MTSSGISGDRGADRGRVRHLIEPEPEPGGRVVIDFDSDRPGPGPTAPPVSAPLSAAAPIAAPAPASALVAASAPAPGSLPPLTPAQTRTVDVRGSAAGPSGWDRFWDGIGMLFTGIGFLFRLAFVALLGFVAYMCFANEEPIVGAVVAAYAIYILCGGRWFFFVY